LDKVADEHWRGGAWPQWGVILALDDYDYRGPERIVKIHHHITYFNGIQCEVIGVGMDCLCWGAQVLRESAALASRGYGLFA
jgi:hypothetical protein